jgi:hypothetical protein
MTLFGVSNRIRVKDTGTFHCPHCGQQQAYARQGIDRAFFIAGIPVVTLGPKPDLIACAVCDYTFNVDVLTFQPTKPQRDAARLLGEVRQRLDKGYSPEYIVQDLIDRGVDPEVAQGAMALARRDADP